MRINTDSPASVAARKESELWIELAGWPPVGWDDTAPTEVAVVGFFDPEHELQRITAFWGHRLIGADLASLGAFGAGLAVAEADAWANDEPQVATRAYSDRRFLLGDRLLHWAVPWLDTVGRCYPLHRDEGHARRDLLLELGDRLRPAPELGGTEGLAPPGEDAYGPLSIDAPLDAWLRSVWSGAVILDATLRSLGGDTPAGWVDLGTIQSRRGTATRRDVATMYEAAAHRWASLAAAHPGSARLWRDLAARATRTAEALSVA